MGLHPFYLLFNDIAPKFANENSKIKGDKGIKTSGIISGIQISVVTVFGELITRKEIIDGKSFMEIVATPGIYFVIIQSQEQKIIRKLVIQ